MILSPVSWIAVAIITAAIGIAWSKRFLASGALIIANVALLLLMYVGGSRQGVLGATPADPAHFFPAYSVIHGELGLYTPNLIALRPEGLLQLVTNLFVHASFGHLLGNMIVLLAFGLPFEERVGHRKFLLIYLATGLAGSLVETFLSVSMGAATLMMGASGAIMGIMGAFAARYPNQVVPVPVPLLFIFIRIPMRVIIGALIYVAYNLFMVLYAASVVGGPTDNTAYGAHFGGLGMGILLAMTMLPKPGTQPGQGPVAVDLGAFAAFARDQQTQTVLAHMRSNNDEPAVFQAWLDRFFRTATCPTCSHRVMPRTGGQIVCTQGHKFDVRKGGKPSAAPVSPS